MFHLIRPDILQVSHGILAADPSDRIEGTPLTPHSPHELNSALLVERIRQGDPAAEHSFVVQFRPRVLCFLQVRARGAEHIEDLAQEVLMSVICALRKGQVRDPESLPSYVHGTARNLLNNHFRNEGRSRTEPLDPAVDVSQSPPDYAAMEREREVEQAIRELPLEDRRILLMTLVDGSRPGEIAAALSLSSDVVRQRKSRALKKLTERFNPMSQTGSEAPHNHMARGPNEEES